MTLSEEQKKIFKIKEIVLIKQEDPYLKEWRKIFIELMKY